MHVQIATEDLETLHPGVTGLGLCFIIKVWLVKLIGLSNSLSSLFVTPFYYALGFKNYACLLKATNYDDSIMYTSLGFMPSLLHVLAVSNSTMQVPCPQFVGFGRCGHTESPMHT